MDHPPVLQGLYAVTAERADSSRLLAEVAQVLDGGARLLQYRAKALPAVLRAEQARSLLALCHAHRVPLIINDDVALAAAIGADGVHLGRDDGDVGTVRQQLGGDAIIGVSCYDSLPLARDAAAAGASYVAFGSMYPTARKPQAPRASLALLREARAALELPLCVIGGITAARAAELVAAGASMLAVIGDLFDSVDPGAAARRYRGLFGSV
jgi:thiamine-phosphate pyrophosphorylase